MITNDDIITAVREGQAEEVWKLHRHGYTIDQIVEKVGMGKTWCYDMIARKGVYPPRKKKGRAPSDVCSRGHSKKEYGEQQYVTGAGGTKVKAGFRCLECKREDARKEFTWMAPKPKGFKRHLVKANVTRCGIDIVPEQWGRNTRRLKCSECEKRSGG